MSEKQSRTNEFLVWRRRDRKGPLQLTTPDRIKEDTAFVLNGEYYIGIGEESEYECVWEGTLLTCDLKGPKSKRIEEGGWTIDYNVALELIEKELRNKEGFDAFVTDGPLAGIWVRGMHGRAFHFLGHTYIVKTVRVFQETGTPEDLFFLTQKTPEDWASKVFSSIAFDPCETPKPTGTEITLGKS